MKRDSQLTSNKTNSLDGLRVLLIDQEPLVRKALSRLINASHPKVELTCVATPEEGESALKHQAFDLIINDSDMIDGRTTQFFNLALSIRPEALRIALSGHAHAEDLIPILKIAQMHLSKPVRLNDLRDKLKRIGEIRDLVGDFTFQALLGELTELPAMPKIYGDLTQALGDPNISVAEIARIIERDSAITTQLLRLVSSSLFAHAGPIYDVQRALILIGLDVTRAFCMAIEAYDIEGLSEERRRSLALHALLTANIAARIASRPGLSEQAFVAGLLHDIGKIVLADKLPQHFERVACRAIRENESFYQIETELDKAAHPQIGAYLLGIWGLPIPLIEAVAKHHERPTELDLSGIVAVADILASEELGDGISPKSRVLDETLINELQLVHRLDDLRQFTKDQAQRIASVL